MEEKKTLRTGWLLAILGLLQFTYIVDFMIVMPLGDILQRDMNIVSAQYSVIVSAYPVAAFISAIFGTFFLDRFDRKSALLLAYAGFIIGTASSAIVPTTESLELNYYLLVSTRVLTGLFGGVIGALVLSIIGDAIPLANRSKAMSISMMAFSLASVLGVPLSLWLVNQYDGNWHVPFYMVSGLGVLIYILVIFFIPPLRGHLIEGKTKPHPFETFRMLARNRAQQLALLFTSLLTFGRFTVIPFITPYLINNVGFSQDEIPLVYLVGGACTVASSAFIGWWADKSGRTKVFYIVSTLSIAPLLLLTSIGPMNIFWVLCVTAAFFIFISGRNIPANTILTTVVKPENRGGFMSLNAGVSSLSSGLSALIAGAIIFQPEAGAPLEGYSWVGYLAVFCTLASMLLVGRLKAISND